MVRSGLGLGDPLLLDDVLILLPFFLAQVAVWWGLYAAEVAMRPAGSRRPRRGGAASGDRARQSLGMVLPVVAGLRAGAGPAPRPHGPGRATSPGAELALMSGLMAWRS